MEKPWKRTPSQLWDTRQGYYGTEYRCTECEKCSESYLTPPTRMHKLSCARVERGEKAKPLVPPKKGGRKLPRRW